MPTPEENRARWTEYDWSQRGDDWSFGSGSSRCGWFFRGPGRGRD